MNLKDFTTTHYVASIDMDSITSEVVRVIDEEFDLNKELSFTARYEPTPGDRIYFLPGCNVPRMKVRDYCDKFRVAITKDPVNANVLVAGPDTKPHYFTELKACKIPVERYIKWLEVCRDEETTHFIDEEINSVKLSLCDYVLVHEDVADMLFGEVQCPWLDELVSVDIDSDHHKTHKYTRIKETDDLSKYSAADGKLFSQDDILVGLNTLVIDDTMYRELRSQLSSKDQGSVVLAMEVMANTRFDLSMPYLLLLMQEFGKRSIAKAKSKDHVNFKSMCQYLGIGPADTIAADDLVDLLRAKNQFTESSMEIIRPSVMKEVAGILRESGMNRFIVTAVELAPEGVVVPEEVEDDEE